jgi:hypothetical protein
MNEQRELGIKQLRHRLAVAIRDTVLDRLHNPRSIAAMTGVPEAELGTVSDLRADERAALIHVVANGIDAGIAHFLYGLDNQPDGLRVLFGDEELNPESLCCLTSGQPPIAMESRFDELGNPKV